MEKMQRVNLLMPPGLWSSLAKAAAEAGHPRASFARMVLQQACKNGLPSGAAAVLKPVVTQARVPDPTDPLDPAYIPPPYDPVVSWGTLKDCVDKGMIYFRDACQDVIKDCARHGIPVPVQVRADPMWIKYAGEQESVTAPPAEPEWTARDAQIAYDEYIAEGWPPEKAEEVIRHACASSGVTDWNPPNGGGKLQ